MCVFVCVCILSKKLLPTAYLISHGWYKAFLETFFFPPPFLRFLENSFMVWSFRSGIWSRFLWRNLAE